DLRRLADKASVDRNQLDFLGGSWSTAKAAMGMLATMTAMGVASRWLMGHGPEAGEDKWRWAARSMIGDALSTIPFASELQPLVDVAITGQFKPAQERGIPGLSMIPSLMKQIGEAFKDDADEDAKKILAVKLAVGILLAGVGLPLRQMQRTGKYIEALRQYEALDTSKLGKASGLVYGEKDSQEANPFNSFSDQRQAQ